MTCEEIVSIPGGGKGLAIAGKTISPNDEGRLTLQPECDADSRVDECHSSCVTTVVCTSRCACPASEAGSAACTAKMDKELHKKPAKMNRFNEKWLYMSLSFSI
ncbi:hypothetical protein [Megasphaera sp.]|uniref:hypothetical protein n=1 Tax=Megasphaera sp. TaxID=2023260 RepID=UPI0025809192|nr:hypothetical protein [Megasphaera sp.]